MVKVRDVKRWAGITRDEKTPAARVAKCGMTSRVLAVEESVNTSTGEITRRKAYVTSLRVPVGNIWEAITKAGEPTSANSWNDFWRIKNSVCYPGDWETTRIQLGNLWHFAGHDVHWTSDTPILAMNFELWMEQDREEREMEKQLLKGRE